MKKDYKLMENILQNKIITFKGITGRLVRRFPCAVILYQENNGQAFVVVPTGDEVTIVCGSIEEALHEKDYIREAL